MQESPFLEGKAKQSKAKQSKGGGIKNPSIYHGIQKSSIGIIIIRVFFLN
jgi:hypothetical protein